MGNGAPAPGAAQRIAKGNGNGSSGDASVDVQAKTFDADERTKVRENTPATIGGTTYKRAKKNWKVSRLMRKFMREQESAVALSVRLRRRCVELETEQMEAAAKGETETEAALETQIEELIGKADDATEAAEAVTYKLLAVLLVTETGATLLDEQGEPDPKVVEQFQEALDVEDAADLGRELSGSTEADPPTTQESATTSA